MVEVVTTAAQHITYTRPTLYKSQADCDGKVALIFRTLHVDFYFFGQTTQAPSFGFSRPRGCAYKNQIANQICATKFHFIINILIDISVKSLI